MSDTIWMCAAGVVLILLGLFAGYAAGVGRGRAETIRLLSEEKLRRLMPSLYAAQHGSAKDDQ